MKLTLLIVSVVLIIGFNAAKAESEPACASVAACDKAMAEEEARYAREQLDFAKKYLALRMYDTAADEMFGAADSYIQAKQPDQARKVYQNIIRTFSGLAFAGHRDRAKMELDILDRQEASAKKK